MQEAIQALVRLPGAALHEEATRRSLLLVRSKWEMVACLRAVEVAGVHEQQACSSATQYAVRFLGLEGYLAAEMLRVGRALQVLPLLSEAFRSGVVSWSKIRDVTRVATADLDAWFTEFARTHTEAEVRQRVLQSPRAYNREKAGASPGAAGNRFEQPDLLGEAGSGGASDSANPQDTPGSENPTGPLPPSGSDSTPGQGVRSDADSTQEGACHAHPEEGTSAASTTSSRGGDGPSGAGSHPGADTTNGASQGESNGTGKRGDPPEPTPPPPPPPPSPPRSLISLPMRLSPEEYALWQAAEQRVRASQRGRMTREAVLAEVCRRAVKNETGAKKVTVKTLLVIHVDPASGKAWTTGPAGAVSVDRQVVMEAFRDAELHVAHEDLSGPDRHSEQPVPAPGQAATPRSEEPPASREEAGHAVNMPVRSTPKVDASDRTASAEANVTGGEEQPKGEPSLSSTEDERAAKRASDKGASARPRPANPKRKRRRPAIPAATLRALHARAGACCESPGCSRRGRLHVHHRRAWSECPSHDLDNLILLCAACHALLHRQDFREKQSWAGARRRAQQCSKASRSP